MAQKKFNDPTITSGFNAGYAGFLIPFVDPSTGKVYKLTPAQLIALFGSQYNLQSGTSYTPALTDGNGVIEMGSSSANTVTIPPNSSTPFPVGTQLVISQYGAGATSIAAGAGVTIRNLTNPGGQYKSVFLYKRATDEWVMSSGSSSGATSTQLNTPTSFAAGSPTSSGIPLTWVDSNTSPNESSFQVQITLATDTGYASVVQTLSPAANATSASGSGLSASTNYRARIKAVGNGSTTTDSTWSTEVTFTTAASGSTQLNAPTTLAAGTPTSSTVPLTWTDTNTSPNEVNFELQQSSDGGTTWVAATPNNPAQNAVSATASSLTASTAYQFRIRAKGNGTTTTDSNWSNVASATTSTAALAMDGITGVSGWGLNKLRTAYAGNACNVRRSSDSTTMDIGFVGNDFDIATFNTFIGAGTGVVTTLYDQGTPALNLTAPTTGECPQLIASGINGKPTLVGSVSALGTAAAYFGAAAQRSLFAVYKNTNTGSFVGAVAGQTGTSAGAGSWFEIQTRTNTVVGDPYLNTYTNSLTDSTTPGTTPRLATALYDGTSTYLRRSGAQIATTAITLNTDAAIFRLFNDQSGERLVGQISAVVAHPTVCLSGTNLAQVESALKSYYGV